MPASVKNMPKRISEKTKFEGRIFRILDVLVRHDNGTEFSYEVMQGRGGSSNAMIIAVDGKKRVVLVKEYFAGINKMQLCVPKGRIDPGEKPIETAARELEEEAGYAAKTLELLGKFCLAPGYSDQESYIYLATGLSKPANPKQGDEVEPMQVVLVPLSTAVKWAKSGKIPEARAVAGLLLAEQFINCKNANSKKSDSKKK